VIILLAKVVNKGKETDYDFLKCVLVITCLLWYIF